jgi:hypothetical protein
MKYTVGSVILTIVSLFLAPGQSAPTTSPQQPAKKASRLQSTARAIRAKVEPPIVPFQFSLGTTSLEEAEARWKESNTMIAARGNAALGYGSGADNRAKLSDPRAVLIDIADVELEGVPPRKVRFAFFDGTLFSVQVRLSQLVDSPNLPRDQYLGEEKITALKKSLTARYGPPKIERMGILELFIWRFGDNELLLNNSTSSVLIYHNLTLSKKAQDSKDAICKQNKKECPTYTRR